MGETMHLQLSMSNVRELLKRNHLAHIIEKNSILFDYRFNRRTGDKSYYEINFTTGAEKIGRQRIVFGFTSTNVYEDDFLICTCIRATECTDMPFFAFHFHDLFPSYYPIDEYNDWNK